MSARSLIWREFPNGCSADSAAGQSLPFLVVIMARSSQDGVSGVLPNHILADTNATANHINLGWRPKWIAEIMSECTASNDAARTSATEPNRSAIVLTDNGGDTWVLRTCALLHSGCIFKSNVSKDTSVVISAAGHFNRCHPSWGIHSVSFLRPSVPPGLVVAQVAPSLMRNLEHSTLQGIRSSSMT